MKTFGILRLYVVLGCSFAGLRLAHAADVPAGVTLSGQRVRFDEAGGSLEVEVTVHNDLDLALTAVEIGWLLAPTAAMLEAVHDPGAAYLASDDPKRVAAPPGVTVLRRDVAVKVPGHGTAPAKFSASFAAVGRAGGEGMGGASIGGVPEVYRTHVLGYTLADAKLPLLLRLLHGSAAADERAAVDYFALAGGAIDKLAARQRLDNSGWVAQLEQRVQAPVPQRPAASELHERLFVVAAIGVVGGPLAEKTLSDLRDRGDIAFFDELLRVVLIDRLRGTRLETSLAFTVPASARTFRDVVDGALSDARTLAERAKAEGESPSSEVRIPRADVRAPNADGRIPIAEVRTPNADDRAPIADDRGSTGEDGGAAVVAPPRKWWPQVVGLAVAAAAAMITGLVLRRRT